MEIDVKPKAKRTVTFEVDEREATQIAGWLNDALNNRFSMNTPYSSEGARSVMNAFAQIRDGK